MLNLKNEFIFRKYLNELMYNQNNTDICHLQDIIDKHDYKYLLKPVLDITRKYPHETLVTWRAKLFNQSGLKEILDIFVNRTQITPGVILDFGTFKSRDTVFCGLSQEYNLKNGVLVRDEKPIENDTIFDLASSSKPFTAISILKLFEDGSLDVFDPVTKYVPEFTKLNNVTIYDLLKFRIKIVTDKRVDSAKSKEEAERILFTVYPAQNQEFDNAYTDMGAMVLKYVVERVSKVPFTEFVSENILKKANMTDTYLNVPEEKRYRVANENFSTIVDKDGNAFTRYDNVPGTPHDTKALAMGELEGNAPGHAGYFSTKDDMVKFAKALMEGKIISKNGVLSMSETETGYQKSNDKFTRFYGSLVYLKQPDPEFLSVYPPLSGKSFMSPGFAGTQLVVDPINEVSLFVGSPRLHNRIYQIHPDQEKNVKIDEYNKRTYTLPNGEEKIVCNNYTKAKEVLVKLALDLTLQYQLLEKMYPTKREMHLVRELN